MSPSPSVRQQGRPRSTTVCRSGAYTTAPRDCGLTGRAVWSVNVLGPGVGMVCGKKRYTLLSSAHYLSLLSILRGALESTM